MISAPETDYRASACCAEAAVDTTSPAIEETAGPVRELKVRRKLSSKISNVTNYQMLVESGTNFSYSDFDRSKIVESLVREIHLSDRDANDIARNAEKILLASGLTCVTSMFVREIVNSVLLEKGFKRELRNYSNLSIPISNIRDMFFGHNQENSNTSFSPESVNLLIAGMIKKQFGMIDVFPREVREAHTVGEIHVHDGDFIDRPYCSGNSVEYIKKYGLSVPGVLSTSSPAKHARTLVNHLSCFANYLQGLFAGAIGFDAVNMFFAPYIVGLSEAEVKQEAQNLIYSFAQLAGARGGQVAFTDFNMYHKIPAHYREVDAIGPGGKYTGKKYGDYEKEARLFLEKIVEVLDDGDADGGNFAFPKILLHVDKSSFEGEDPILKKVCAVNARRGSVYMVFDRGENVRVSQCCRLSVQMEGRDLERIKNPEELRFSAWQNISINLPRIAYKYKEMGEICLEIDRLVDIAMKAHLAKRDFVTSLLDEGDRGLLGFLAKGMDGKPYLRRDEAKFLIGMIGLNEMVECLTGKQLHESEDSFMTGLRIMSHLFNSIQKHANEYNVTCLLEETPAEGLTNRAALLDYKYYPESHKYIRGSNEPGNEFKYYTNSVHLAYDSHVDIATRIEKQSKFTPLIQAGSIIHVWLGESNPDPDAIYNLVKSTYFNTRAMQLAFSPDLTVCSGCHRYNKGLHEKCPKCNSEKVYQITRITGYFSKISGWTKGKLAELSDRTRHQIDKLPSNDRFAAADDRERILFFSKPGCEKCDFIKERLAGNDVTYDVMDTTTDEGLANACYFDVEDLPAMIKVKGHHELARWNNTESAIKWLKKNRIEQ